MENQRRRAGALATDGEGRRGKAGTACCALAAEGEARRQNNERRAPAFLAQTARIAEEMTTVARRALSIDGEGR